LHAAVQLIVHHFIQIDEAFHAALRHRLGRLLRLGWRRLDQAAILLLVLLQLLVERAHSFFLHLFRLGSLELVDVADERVLCLLMLAFVRLMIFEDVMQVALQEVKPGDVVPWLKDVSSEDHDLMLGENTS